MATEEINAETIVNEEIHSEKEKPSIKKKISRIWKKVKDFTVSVCSRLWQGAAIGAIAAAVVYAGIYGAYMKTGLGRGLDITLSVLVILILIPCLYAISLIVAKLIKSFPNKFIASILAVFTSLAITNLADMGMQIVLLGVVTGSLIGFAFLRGIRKSLSVIILVIILAADIFIITELAKSGYDTDITAPANFSSVKVAALNAADPSREGNYQVQSLFYGSGWDKQRPEYNKSVSIKTPTVDVTTFLAETTGVKNNLRQWFWGFGPKNFPLNARVWYPLGEGRFPLILIVHGNHKMEEFSDPGYEYLGKMLASRGFITASVDENFLNGNWIKDYQQSENIVRGFMLLKHLESFKHWNETKGNIFFDKVDMNNILLIGHSRGGQAVAIAAAINKMQRYHIDAKVRFDFNFAIKGIVEIAPNDPYQPTTGNPLLLSNINYLLLQGGHDGDVSMFLGNRQYNRVKFTDDNYYFKSAVYIYHANHGQFNTVWGREDMGRPFSWIFNLKPIMKAEDQRRIAKIYISAFAETILHGKKEYTPLFKDYRTALSFLPKDIYISQFQDSKYKNLADFEDDFDVNTASVKGCTFDGENLKVWSENGLTLRDGGNTPQMNNVAYLGWDYNDKQFKGKTARYSLTLCAEEIKQLALNDKDGITFSICNNKDQSTDSLDLTIELKDESGASARFPLSTFGMITPPLKVQVLKWKFLKDFGVSGFFEKVLQRFEIPFTELKKITPSFNASKLKQINFVFDKSNSGEIALDNIGIQKSL